MNNINNRLTNYEVIPWQIHKIILRPMRKEKRGMRTHVIKIRNVKLQIPPLAVTLALMFKANLRFVKSFQ